MKLSEIKANPDNPRVLRDAKFDKLKKSIQEFPKMMSLRPLVIDENNIVLGGNMRLRALQDLGYKEIPDQWVKRADELNEEEKRRFIIADNVSFGEWDYDDLANKWEAEDLSDWGLDITPSYGDEDLDTNTEESTPAHEYTKKIKAPVYEPKNEKPEPVKLYDTTKYKQLIDEIENSFLDEDVKTFLMVAAARHIVFNYENIADYYAHSDASVQRLMENSALVIIDMDRAIENGFVRLTERLFDIQEEESEDDEA